MMSSNPSGHVTLLPKHSQTLLSGPITIADMLNVVAAVGNEPRDVDAQLMKIYEWHHARGVAAVQLAFTPAAVAALAIVAKGATTGVIIAASAIVVVSVSVGLWRLSHVNRVHSEYALALRLGRALVPFRKGLESHLYYQPASNTSGAACDSTARRFSGANLYDDIGTITLDTYLSDARIRDDVREALTRAGAAYRSEPEPAA